MIFLNVIKLKAYDLLHITVAGLRSAGFGAYKLSTYYKGNWEKILSKPTNPHFLNLLLPPVLPSVCVKGWIIGVSLLRLF
jgi:hypothetical protein